MRASVRVGLQANAVSRHVTTADRHIASYASTIATAHCHTTRASYLSEHRESLLHYGVSCDCDGWAINGG